MNNQTQENNDQQYIEKLEQGKQLYRKGRFMEAEQIYREILEQNPEDRNALQYMLDSSRLMRKRA